jgi:hypothetical protein
MFSQKRIPGIRLAASAFAAVALLGGGVAHASIFPRVFSFNAVEFMPSDQRMPAAQAFVSQNVATGTPVPVALQVLRKAGAYCRTSKDAADAISCVHPSFQKHPDDAGTLDIDWVVRITPTTDGTVAAASVNREVSGF